MSEKKQRKAKVKATIMLTGEVTEGCEEAVITFVAHHLRQSPMSVTDADGNRLAFAYEGGGRFRVELDS